MPKHLRYGLVALAISAFSIGCAESKSNPEEEAAIRQMDSTSQAVKDSTERLEEQTRKVEETLEKLDKEFPSNQQTR